jgi:hypothetical protein
MPFLPAGARWPSAGRESTKWSLTARSRRRADRVRRTRVRYARKASNQARLASTELADIVTGGLGSVRLCVEWAAAFDGGPVLEPPSAPS